jgi:excinuclease UvrABC ATPase subunit
MKNKYKRTITRTKSKSKCPVCRERLISVNASFRYCPVCTPIGSNEELSEFMLKDQHKREEENNVKVWTNSKYSQEYLFSLVEECRK